MSRLLSFTISISNAWSGVAYLVWHPIRRPVIGVRLVATTPQVGANVSAKLDSGGFFISPTAPHWPSYAFMYCSARHPRPWLSYSDDDLWAVLLLLISDTSWSAGLPTEEKNWKKRKEKKKNECLRKTIIGFEIWNKIIGAYQVGLVYLENTGLVQLEGLVINWTMWAFLFLV